MSMQQGMAFILISTLDPMPPWGALTEFQTLAIHEYIHLAWHILPSPNPHSFVHVDNGPPGLSPLDTNVIQWDILKDGICLLELFGGISFGLSTIIKSGILIQKCHYAEKNP
jgi:hypothetical protein